MPFICLLRVGVIVAAQNAKALHSFANASARFRLDAGIAASVGSEILFEAG